MTRTRQISQKGPKLAHVISGYSGYSTSEAASRTDRAFSEEIISRLSETMATVTRIERTASDSLDANSAATLDSIAESVDRLARNVADGSPTDGALKNVVKNGRAAEIVRLDSEILEKTGNINQVLSMLDLEAGAVISFEDLEAVSELLDDLADSLRQRTMLISA